MIPKHHFATLICALMIGLGLASCDKCKDVQCPNGTCNPETGECGYSEVCENGTRNTKTGECECNNFYRGDGCDLKAVNDFTGTWTGSFRCDQGNVDTTVVMDTLIIEIIGQGDIKTVTVRDTFRIAPNQEFTGELDIDNQDKLVIAPQKVDYDYGSEEPNYSGSFTITGSRDTLVFRRDIIPAHYWDPAYFMSCTGIFVRK